MTNHIGAKTSLVEPTTTTVIDSKRINNCYSNFSTNKALEP